MIAPELLAVQLTDVQTLTPDVKQFTFASADAPLPAFSGGSHIVLSVKNSRAKFRNSYSLIGGPDRTDSYQIAVKLAEQSRGGSSFLHSLEQAGAEVSISYPFNTFPLARTARHLIFIAGGIGITPFLTLIEDANSARISWELHYAVRSRQNAAFFDRLHSHDPSRVSLYAADQQVRLDLLSVLENQKLGTHAYVCGPDRLITATLQTASALGWPERYIHFEHFQSVGSSHPFTVELARSGKTVYVDSGVSLLEALEAADVDVPYSCRGGACGACETVVLSGVPDHRDHYLSNDLKASGRLIMPCVSRSRSERLVLNL